MIRHRTVPSRYRLKVSRASRMTRATAHSSRTNGKMRAPENGHPNRAPIPNHMIPEADLAPPCQSMNEVNPKVVVYMAKLDGKKATEA